MVAFTAADLQRRPADLQRAALREPTYLTYHEKLRYVFLSIEDYVRLGGLSVEVPPRGLPRGLLQRLSDLAARHDTIEFEGATPNKDDPYGGEVVSGLLYRRAVHSLLGEATPAAWAVALIGLEEGEQLRDATARRPSGSTIAAHFTARGDDFLSLPIQLNSPAEGQTGLKVPKEFGRSIGAEQSPYLIVSSLLVDSVPRNARTIPKDALFLPGSLVSSIASKILQLAKAGQ